MKCEKCNEEHDGSYGSGRFCSAECARSFSRNKDVKETKKVNCCVCGIEIEVGKRAADTLCKCEGCREQPKRNFDERVDNCLFCSKELGPNLIKYCSYDCQIRFQRKLYIEAWKAGNEDGISAKYSISAHIRNYLFEKYDNQCAKCGWGEVNPHTGRIPLEVEHIDGNFRNNVEENLILLCPNCHSLTATYKGANRGNGRKDRRKYDLE
jgi:hypothetical protein